jgi:hypothetical protein
MHIYWHLKGTSFGDVTCRAWSGASCPGNDSLFGARAMNPMYELLVAKRRAFSRPCTYGTAPRRSAGHRGRRSSLLCVAFGTQSVSSRSGRGCQPVQHWRMNRLKKYVRQFVARRVKRPQPPAVLIRWVVWEVQGQCSNPATVCRPCCPTAPSTSLVRSAEMQLVAARRGALASAHSWQSRDCTARSLREPVEMVRPPRAVGRSNRYSVPRDDRTCQHRHWQVNAFLMSC